MKKDKEAKKKKKEKSVQVSVPETVKTVSPETEDAILETLLQHIGGKWKIRIIWALQNAQSKRYSTLKNEVSSITDVFSVVEFSFMESDELSSSALEFSCSLSSSTESTALASPSSASAASSIPPSVPYSS